VDSEQFERYVKVHKSKVHLSHVYIALQHLTFLPWKYLRVWLTTW